MPPAERDIKSPEIQKSIKQHLVNFVNNDKVVFQEVTYDNIDDDYNKLTIKFVFKDEAKKNNG